MGPAPTVPTVAPGPPEWTRLGEIPACVAYRPHLVRTALTSGVVGTVLFLINHLDAVVRGQATTATWVATGVSYVVPFLVANTGLVIARRRVPAGKRSGTEAPAWNRLGEIPRCLAHRRHLLRTVGTALLVGTVYFCVNQLATVLAGESSLSTWVGSGVTYLVPFCVANLGVLVGTRRLPAPVPATTSTPDRWPMTARGPAG